MQVRLTHSEEPVEVHALRIKIDNNEFLIKQKSEGLHIVEITDNCIYVRPDSGNSIVLVTKKQ